MSEKFAAFLRDGYCVFENMLDAPMLERMRTLAQGQIDRISPEHMAAQRATGTLVHSNDMPEFAELLAYPKALQTLEQHGIHDCAMWKANFISKPPGGPQLYWHHDGNMWQDPRSYQAMPPAIFLMYYFVDTTRHNGCLRVLPGTHRKRHPIHDMGTAHEGAINSMENPDDPRFGEFAGEVDVPVKAGDLVVGDSRMLHAAHANASEAWRSLITIWYFPEFSGLQEPSRRWVHDQFHRLHDAWPAQALDKVATVTPRYHGNAEPLKVQRTPGPLLV